MTQKDEALRIDTPKNKCLHDGEKETGWDEVRCCKCGWIVPSGQIIGIHDGWFPSHDAHKEYKKYFTYQGMNEVYPIDKSKAALSEPETVNLPDGWISVKDRLPEKSGEYLCGFYEWVGLKEQKPKDPTVAIKLFDKYWRKRQYFYDTGGYENLEVTHWMPLPAAPILNEVKNKPTLNEKG